MTSTGQLDLFAGEPPSAPAAPKGTVASAAVPDTLQALAAQLPPSLRMGGSTWSYPGWKGLVYAGSHTPAQLAQGGLAAYARHPLLRCVGIDRSFYAPLPPEAFRALASQVPEDFRFVVKAHEHCTLAHFPLHERYGAQRGQRNPRFLDPLYAAEQVVSPIQEGLGDKAGIILFQFPPQDVLALGGVDAFINQLYRFLRALPPGPLYAVEVRNAELLTERFARALEYAGALPALAGWGHLPPLSEQATLTRAAERPALFIRWILRWGLPFEEGETRYAPFDRLAEPDPDTRREAVALCREALTAGKPVFLVVGNTAEGCSPLTVQALAESIALPAGAPAAGPSAER